MRPASRWRARRSSCTPSSRPASNKAQRQDLLATTHQARVQQLIAEAAGNAATAQQNAAEASQVAALAQKKAAEAKEYARQAQASAADAKASAADAAQSAKEAEASAARAADSAKTARQAEADANRASADAANSASDASVSAELAHISASTAWAAADQARASAVAAGKDAEATLKAAKEAFDIAAEKVKAEAEAQRKAYAEAREKARNDPKQKAYERYKCPVLGCEAFDNPVRWCQQNKVACYAILKGSELEPGLRRMLELEKEILSITQLQGCIKQVNSKACGELAINAAIGSKIKLLHKAYEDLRILRRGCTKCFLAGTKVLMGDTSTHNIEDIRRGDKVLATNPVTGETAPRKVTRLIVTEGDKHFNELTIATRNGPRKITATYEHPFWSPSEHRWIKANEAKSGTSLLSNDRTTVRVQANRAFDRHARTYNLTVENLHTYYVLAGTTAVLVHNSDCFPDLGESWTPKPAAQVCGTGGCEAVADNIQSVIGGDIMRITDRYGAPQLGKYRGVDSGWNYHDVVVKNGRVFDATTGRRGEPIDEYLVQFEYGEDLVFNPAPR
ncbi:polymorphic toxin-type HINT domain-containing protein [Streptomyces sp. NPDC001667]